MKTATPLFVARLIVAFIALLNVFGGVIWFGQLAPLLVAAGAGLVAWLSARPLEDQSRVEKVLFLAGVMAVLAGESISAADYYMNLDIPGNNHGWPLRAPFIALTLFIWWGVTYGARHLFLGPQADDS